MDFSEFGEIACIKETHKFYGNRIIGTTMGPLKWTLTVTMTPLVMPEVGEISKSVVAYEKCKFWMEHVLEDVLISSMDNELGANLCYYTDNTTMLTPYPPTDNHILQLLHSKLTVIAGPELHIGLMTLESSEANSVSVFRTETNSHNLPNMKEHEDSMYHSEPWWKRSTFDFSDYTKDEVENDEELKGYLDADCPLETFATELLRMYDQETDKSPETAEIIKMPKKWSPKIV